MSGHVLNAHALVSGVRDGPSKKLLESPGSHTDAPCLVSNELIGLVPAVQLIIISA